MNSVYIIFGYYLSYTECYKVGYFFISGIQPPIRINLYDIIPIIVVIPLLCQIAVADKRSVILLIAAKRINPCME